MNMGKEISFLKVFVCLTILYLVAINISGDTNKYEIKLVFCTMYDDIDPSVPLPYLEDFESGTFDCVLDRTPYCKWKIIDDGGNKRLLCYDLKQDEITDGNPVFGLMIGDKTWGNYIFSFDCKIPEGSSVMFAPFADTNADNYTPDYFESRNPWSLELDHEGVLVYQTVFVHGWHYIGEESNARDEAGNKKSKPIDSFLVGEWNHIRLIPAGLDVQMELNGANIGKVAELQEDISGRVAIGGRIGCMFDNISVEEALDYANGDTKDLTGNGKAVSASSHLIKTEERNFSRGNASYIIQQQKDLFEWSDTIFAGTYTRSENYTFVYYEDGEEYHEYYTFWYFIVKHIYYGDETLLGREIPFITWNIIERSDISPMYEIVMKENSDYIVFSEKYKAFEAFEYDKTTRETIAAFEEATGATPPNLVSLWQMTFEISGADVFITHELFGQNTQTNEVEDSIAGFMNPWVEKQLSGSLVQISERESIFKYENIDKIKRALDINEIRIQTDAGEKSRLSIKKTMLDDFLEEAIQYYIMDNANSGLKSEFDAMEALARKAIDFMNEMAGVFPEFYKCFQYSDIKCIRELYTPTTNVILAYLFELEDDNGNCGCVVMNAFSREFMQMGDGKSKYAIYLEESGKTELEDNEKFIYHSIDCWVGTIQGDEVVIVSTYTNEIIAVERRDNVDIDRQYQDFYTNTTTGVLINS